MSKKKTKTKKELKEEEKEKRRKEEARIEQEERKKQAEAKKKEKEEESREIMNKVIRSEGYEVEGLTERERDLITDRWYCRGASERYEKKLREAYKKLKLYRWDPNEEPQNEEQEELKESMDELVKETKEDIELYQWFVDDYEEEINKINEELRRTDDEP